MKRFVYRPEVEAYIWLEDAQRYIDVTNDIIDCSITRRLNAVSSASLTLQNRDNRYVRLMKPMDRIAIWLTRTQRMLAFTGYLDETPVLQLYPHPVKIEASCTLKLLQNTYFDPGLPFMIQFFQDNGNFLYDPTSGTLNDAQQRFGNFDAKGGWATALRAVLNKIGGFPDDNIHITGIPPLFLTGLAEQLTAAQKSDAADSALLLKRIDALLNHQTRSGQTDNLTTDDYGNSNANAAAFKLALKKNARALLTLDQQYNAGVIWGVAKEFNLPDLVCVGLVANAYAESSLTANRLNTSGSGATGLFQLLGSDWYGANGWLAKAVKKSHPESHPNPQPTSGTYADAITVNPVYNTRAYILANRDVNYSTITHQAYLSNLPSGTPQIPIYPQAPNMPNAKPYEQIIAYWARPGAAGSASDYTRAVKIWPALLKTIKDLATADTGNATLATTTPTARKSSQQTATTTTADQGPYVNPFRQYNSSVTIGRTDMGVDFETGKAGLAIGAIGDGTVTYVGDGGAFGPTFITYRLSQPVQSSVSGAGGLIFIGHSQAVPGLTQGAKIKKGQTIALTHGGSYGGPVGHVEIGWADPLNHAAPLALPHYTEGDVTAEGTDFKQFYLTLALTGGASDTATDTSSQTTTEQNANLGFFSLQLQSSDFAESTLLQGKRALANDVSLFEWITTMATAGGRAFCSLPNGDFYAFFPDYFQWFGARTPYFSIQDIEIINLNGYLSDRDLKTHVFTAGSRFTDKVETWDRILSQVASVEETAGFNVFINRGVVKKGKTVREAFDPIKFLSRYGARPFVYDMPQVRHPLLLWMAAWMKFTEMWSGIYTTEAEFTFMPELIPGGLVSFGGRFTMYVEEVTHDIDRTSGFRTSATMKAPSSEGNSQALGPLLLANAHFDTSFLDAANTKAKKRTKPVPKKKTVKKAKKK